MKPARCDDENYHPYYRQVQRKLNYAIIDEVDNILIDEARTPLIISGPAFSDLKRYEQANAIAVQLIELEKKDRAEENARRAAAGEPLWKRTASRSKATKSRSSGSTTKSRKRNAAAISPTLGVRKAEELAGVESFYTAGNMEWPHLLDNSLKAHTLYQRDRHYLVMDHEGERQDRHHRRIHRPGAVWPPVERRPASGGRGQAQARRRRHQAGNADAGDRSRCKTTSSSIASWRA